MSHESNVNCGCAEYEALERRQWLQAACRMGALAMASAPAWMPKLSFASGDPVVPERDLLVVVFLRGGADGLSFCVPYADPYYASSRGLLAVPPPDSSAPLKAIDLNGYFGLPPGLARLKPIYDAGHLAVVHATGNPAGIRSHFRDQDQMELATPTSLNGSSGWLGRHLLSVSASAVNLRGISTNYSIPRSMSGAPGLVELPSNFYGLSGDSHTNAERRAFLQEAYRTASSSLSTNAAYIISALQTMSGIDRSNRSDSSIVGDRSGSGMRLSGDGMMTMADTMPTGIRSSRDAEPTGSPEYPANFWGRSFRMVAELAKAQVGLEAASIDLGGWDTHVGQGTTDGYLNYLMTEFAQCVEAFYFDMQNLLGSFTMVVMSEFGRQVAPNASGGCDHGTGGAMFVMGGNVNGGRVFTNWPGLNPDQLNQHLDLAITTDYRDILGEILAMRADNMSLPTVFPGYTPVFRGVVR